MATTTPNQRLDGKVALVTGASRGIGLGIVRAFAAAGARVMMVARKAEALEEAARGVDGEVAWRSGHAGKPEDAEACVQETLDRFGSIDILVNNAATNPYAGPTIDVDLPRWEKTFEINVRGPLLWTQVAWRKGMKEHGGSVINISSIGGLRTNQILGVYDVSKAALIHLTKQLAAELAPGVRVNALAPGLIRTDFARALWEGGRGEKVAQAYPLKRLGEPEDVAAAALFLAADTGSWITGQTLVLDGGDLIKFPN
ncbi:MAG: SDR family oxidoreductase [Deltaproteobacteria bacterium]|nr:SDR family oxidoreductase [Deltaproteobacteria bacterium]